MKAIWEDTIIAESTRTTVVEGNHYFPEDSIKWDYLKSSETTSVCPWKGNAVYYHISVAGKDFPDGAWSYPEPKKEAQHIKGYVAFYPQVRISD